MTHDAPVLHRRFPMLAAGFRYLAAVAEMDPAALQRHVHALNAEGIASAYLAAVDVRLLVDQVVRPALNRETEDRFLSRGLDDVERAVRAHVRESPELQRVIADASHDDGPTQRSAAWRRNLEALQQATREAQQAAETARAQYEAEIETMRAMRREMEAVAGAYRARSTARQLTNPVPPDGRVLVDTTSTTTGMEA